MKYRRPLLPIWLLFISGICLQHYLNMNLWILIFFETVMMTVFFISKNRNVTIFSIVMGILIFGGIWMNTSNNNKAYLNHLEGQRGMVKGTVISVKEKKTDFNKLTIKTEAITFGEQTYRVKEKILCDVKGEISHPQDFIGRKVQLKGTFHLPSKARNPGTFDYALYLKSIGIYSTFTAPNGIFKMDTALDKPLLHKMALFRESFSKGLLKTYDENTAGIMMGVMFGEKSNIEENVYEMFQKNGTAHILAVSGLHIGMIYSCLILFFQNRKNIWMRVGIVIILLLYAMLCGFSVSVNRAVAMIMTHIFADTIHRRYDLISSASFIALLFSLWNPYAIFNAGFILSFLAVFSIATIHVTLERRIKRKNWVVKNMLPCFSIQLGMLPITAYQFNYVSWSSFFVNIPIVFLSGLLIPFGMVLMIVCMIGQSDKILFDFIAAIPKVCIQMMIQINDITCIKGLGYITVVSPAKGMLFGYYSIILLFCSEMVSYNFRYRCKKRVNGALCFFLLIAILGSVVEERKRPDMVFLDVGQGDCIHLRTEDGKNILIDSGGSLDPSYDVGKKVVLPYLLKNNVSQIDYAIVTHMDADHYRGFESLSKEMKICNFILSKDYEKDIKEISERFGIAPSCISFLSKGDQIEFSKQMGMEVVYPLIRKEMKSDENAKSLVVKILYQDVKLLMTGDIGEKEEAELNGNINAHVIKVPHHGSKYSSAEKTIERVNPKIAVIQVGKNNNFGHPAKGIIERYEKSGIIIFRTDLHGAIMMKNKGQRNSVYSMLGEEKYEF